MKITTIKNKYPEFWEKVYTSIEFDCIEAIKPSKWNSKTLERIVYNATVVAILEHHKQLKLLKKNNK